MSKTILIIDDEADIREVLADIFNDEGYSTLKAAHSEQAFSVIKNNKIDLIVLDIWLDNSDMDGIQILKTLKNDPHFRTIPILMISGHGNVEMAVNAMKLGAFDFIEKPFKIDHILLNVGRALEQKTLKEENQRLKSDDNSHIIDHAYQSPAMINLLKAIEDNADSDARCLIMGEQGTGKNRLAQLIHKVSKRSKFDLINFRATNDDIKNLEAEIIANSNGTIIIENIDFLSKSDQASLLLILNNKDYKCRIIATVTGNIKDKIDNQLFSSSLYDRIALTKYVVPPLRKRKEDIPVLIENFVTDICENLNLSAPNLSDDIYTLLNNYNWLGNIRQLKIAIEWIIISYAINPKDPFTINDLDFLNYSPNVIEYVPTQKSEMDHGQFYDDLSLKDAREQFERKYLIGILYKYSGNIAKMSNHVGMERTALYRKLKLMDITYDDEIESMKAGNL